MNTKKAAACVMLIALMFIFAGCGKESVLTVTENLSDSPSLVTQRKLEFTFDAGKLKKVECFIYFKDAESAKKALAEEYKNEKSIFLYGSVITFEVDMDQYPDFKDKSEEEIRRFYDELNFETEP